MLGQVIRLAELGGGALIVAILAVELARRPIALLYLVLGVYFWGLVGTVPAITLAGARLGVEDVVNLVAIVVVAIRMRHPRGYQWALLGFTFIVLYQVVRAMLVFGQGEAMLGFRAELYYIVPALLASTLTARHFEPAFRVVWRFGLWAAAIAAARWLAIAVGLDFGPAPDSGGYEVARVINAGAALWVAVAGVMGIWRWLNEDATSRLVPWISLSLFAVVLFAQHRSVWVATAIMLALVIVRTRLKLFLRVGLVVGLVAIAGAVEVLGLGASGEVAESLSYAASNTGTWEWRVQRWQDVWSTHAARGPLAIVFGSGYGYSWVTGTVGIWEASPHNGFIQIAVRTGLAGVVLLFGASLAVVIGLARRQQDGLLFTFMVGILVYFVPYSGSPFSGLLLGLAIACAGHPSANAVPPSPTTLRSDRTYFARLRL